MPYIHTDTGTEWRVSEDSEESEAIMNTNTDSATAAAAGATAAAEEAKPYLNPTSRLHKWVCSCTTHIVNEVSGRTAAGPYVIRIAGTGALVSCGYCGDFFRIADAPPTRRLYRGCVHCDNPEAHTHGKLCGAANPDSPMAERCVKPVDHEPPCEFTVI